MTPREEFLTKLAYLRNGSSEIDFADLETFISRALDSLSLLWLAYKNTFEHLEINPRPEVISVSYEQRETLSHALHGVDEELELIKRAWKLAFEAQCGERASGK